MNAQKKTKMPYPSSDDQLEALPYLVWHGKWGIVAFTRGLAHIPLAERAYPVVANERPLVTPQLTDSMFDELDKEARANIIFGDL